MKGQLRHIQRDVSVEVALFFRRHGLHGFGLLESWAGVFSILSHAHTHSIHKGLWSKVAHRLVDLAW